jgi:hypothetical protein
LALVAIVTAASAQNHDTIPYKLVAAAGSDFSVDNLGNIYVITSENQLKKLSATGDSIAVYNDVRRFGRLHFIDVTNPLKLVLFYRDFATIVILDRMLNVRNTIDLRKQNIFQPGAIALAYDNNIWVYDEQAARLKRIADDGSLVAETNDLRLVFDSVPSPRHIADQNSLVYIYDSTLGVYMFDYFGTLKNRVQLRGLADFDVMGNIIYGRTGDKLISYQSGSLSIKEHQMPAYPGEIKKMKTGGTKIYILGTAGLAVYDMKE